MSGSLYYSIIHCSPLRGWFVTETVADHTSHWTLHLAQPCTALAPSHAPEPVTDNQWGIFVTFVTWALLSRSVQVSSQELESITKLSLFEWFFFCCEPFSVLESIKMIKTTLSLTITYGWWYPCSWCICSAQSNLLEKYWLHYKHSTFPAFSPQLI